MGGFLAMGGILLGDFIAFGLAGGEVEQVDIPDTTDVRMRVLCEPSHRMRVLSEPKHVVRVLAK